MGGLSGAGEDERRIVAHVDLPKRVEAGEPSPAETTANLLRNPVTIL
jgi:hypothetical protein